MSERLTERSESIVLVEVIKALVPSAKRTPGMGGLVDWDGVTALIGAIEDGDVRLLAEGLGILPQAEFDNLEAHAAKAGEALDAFLSSTEGHRAVLAWLRERQPARVMKSCGSALVEQWLHGVSSDEEMAATACALAREAGLSLLEGTPPWDGASRVGQAVPLGNADAGQRREVLAGRVCAILSMLPVGSHWARLLARYGAGVQITMRQTDEDAAAMDRLLRAFDMLVGKERRDAGGGDGNDLTSE